MVLKNLILFFLVLSVIHLNIVNYKNNRRNIKMYKAMKRQKKLYRGGKSKPSFKSKSVPKKMPSISSSKASNFMGDLKKKAAEGAKLAADKAAKLKEEGIKKAAELKEKAAKMKEEAMVKAAKLKEEAMVKAAKLKEEALEKAAKLQEEMERREQERKEEEAKKKEEALENATKKKEGIAVQKEELKKINDELVQFKEEPNNEYFEKKYNELEKIKSGLDLTFNELKTITKSFSVEEKKTMVEDEFKSYEALLESAYLNLQNIGQTLHCKISNDSSQKPADNKNFNAIFDKVLNRNKTSMQKLFGSNKPTPCPSSEDTATVSGSGSVEPGGEAAVPASTPEPISGSVEPGGEAAVPTSTGTATAGPEMSTSDPSDPVASQQ
jgi:hypothetical protein